MNKLKILMGSLAMLALSSCLTPKQAWLSVKMKYNGFKAIEEKKHIDSNVKLVVIADTFIKLLGVIYNAETGECDFVTVVVNRDAEAPSVKLVKVPTVLYSVAGAVCDLIPDTPVE